MTKYLLLEDGGYLLLEDGGRLILEDSLIGTMLGPSLLSGGPIGSAPISAALFQDDSAPAAIPFEALLELSAVDIIHLVKIMPVTKVG